MRGDWLAAVEGRDCILLQRVSSKQFEFSTHVHGMRHVLCTARMLTKAANREFDVWQTQNDLAQRENCHVCMYVHILIKVNLAHILGTPLSRPAVARHHCSVWLM